MNKSKITEAVDTDVDIVDVKLEARLAKLKKLSAKVRTAFEESEHPRDKGGEFTTSGGGGGAKEEKESKPEPKKEKLRDPTKQDMTGWGPEGSTTATRNEIASAIPSNELPSVAVEAGLADYGDEKGARAVAKKYKNGTLHIKDMKEMNKAAERQGFFKDVDKFYKEDARKEKNKKQKERRQKKKNPYGGHIHTKAELDKKLESMKGEDKKQNKALDKLKFSKMDDLKLTAGLVEMKVAAGKFEESQHPRGKGGEFTCKDCGAEKGSQEELDKHEKEHSDVDTERKHPDSRDQGKGFRVSPKGAEHDQTIKGGDIVAFSEPEDDDEKHERFTVVNDGEDRVTIRPIGREYEKMTFVPTNVISKDQLVNANSEEDMAKGMGEEKPTKPKKEKKPSDTDTLSGDTLPPEPEGGYETVEKQTDNIWGEASTTERKKLLRQSTNLDKKSVESIVKSDNLNDSSQRVKSLVRDHLMREKRVMDIDDFLEDLEDEFGDLQKGKLTYRVSKDDTFEFRTSKLRTGSLVDDFRPSNGDRYVSYFLLNDEENLKGWGVQTASIPKNIDTFKGMPFVVTSKKFFADSPYGTTTDHPSTEHFKDLNIRVGRDIPPQRNDMMLQASFQEKFRVGNIEEIIRAKDGNYLAFIKVDPKFANHEMPPLVSPAIFQLNPMEPADNIRTWVGMHLAGLDERPAYGNYAVYKGSCNGDKGSCLTQLSASMPKFAQSLPPCTMKKIFAARVKVASMRLMMSAAQMSSDHPQIQKLNVYGETHGKRERSGGGPGSGRKSEGVRLDEEISRGVQRGTPKKKKLFKFDKSSGTISLAKHAKHKKKLTAYIQESGVEDENKIPII